MINQQSQIIGLELLVDFPEIELFAVPAKVDTGADVSAIWSTKHFLKDSKLVVTFFNELDKDLPSQTREFSEFGETTIRNSFGHLQSRYWVNLEVKINGQLIKERFSLSNRSRNSKAVLIGVNVLRHNFLVDVNHNTN